MPPRRYKPSDDTSASVEGAGSRALRSATKAGPEKPATKRGRAGTTGSSATKSSKKGSKAQRTEGAPGSVDPSDTPDQPAQTVAAHSTTRHYTTRPGNDPHPAQSAGLQKRKKADILAEAQAKRSVKAQETAKRVQEQDEQDSREKRGAEKIAALLDKQVADDAADTHYIKANEAVAATIRHQPEAGTIELSSDDEEENVTKVLHFSL